LAKYFIKKYSVEMGMEAKTLAKTALEVLEAYDWPGNVRELRHLIERAVVLARGRFIEVEHLPDSVRAAADAALAAAASRAVIEVPVGTPLADVERLLIDETLRRTGGNRQRTADLLGIAARTVYRKLSPSSGHASHST
jgi:two-component system response regulator HydG